MKKYFKIVKDSNPSLRLKSEEIKEITPELISFVNDMHDYLVASQNEEISKKYNFNKIICADARGFLFGSALAYKLNKGLVLARKPGKLPSPGFSYSYDLEYGSNTLVTPKDSIKENDRVLVIDDLLATGGSAGAMIELVKMGGGTPVAALFYIELPDLNGRANIKKVDDLPIHSLVCFEGE